MILIDVRDFYELAGGAYVLARCVAQSGAQLVSSGFLDRHCQVINEAAFKNALVSLAAHTKRVCAADLIYDRSVISESYCENIKDGLVPTVRLIRKRQILRIYVKQRAHERALLRIVCEKRCQAQVYAALCERRSERRDHLLCGSARTRGGFFIRDAEKACARTYLQARMINLDGDFM